jgi:hypothetical protein
LLEIGETSKTGSRCIDLKDTKSVIKTFNPDSVSVRCLKSRIQIGNPDFKATPSRLSNGCPVINLVTASREDFTNLTVKDIPRSFVRDIIRFK